MSFREICCKTYISTKKFLVEQFIHSNCPYIYLAQGSLITKRLAQTVSLINTNMADKIGVRFEIIFFNKCL